MTCQLNERRVFSNADVIETIKELDVQLVAVDFTNRDPVVNKELVRTGRKLIPVNLIYPPEYPVKPAIMLNELVTPDDVLFVLNYLSEQSKEFQDSKP